MKTGDPKKAAVLGAVALIIIGVAIFQVIPKPRSAPTAEVARAEGQVVATTEKKTTASLPTTLTSQPFAKPTIPPPIAPPIPPMPGKTKRLAFGRTSGPMGNVPYNPPPPGASSVPDGSTGSDSGSATLPDASGKQTAAGGAQTGPIGMPPGENTGNSQQLKGDQPKTLTFNGVMEVHGRTAMITVSDKPDDVRECKVGSKVAGYTVTNITSDTLILHRDKTTLKFTVGSSHSL